MNEKRCFNKALKLYESLHATAYFDFGLSEAKNKSKICGTPPKKADARRNARPFRTSFFLATVLCRLLPSALLCASALSYSSRSLRERDHLLPYQFHLLLTTSLFALLLDSCHPHARPHPFFL
ncbi:MAG: hypothetical protein LBE57_06275 [Methanosarcinales archaeon]|jgi:hypothetical protein|nr:hypothetical protein [Methanosarcinales archaeon]